MRPPPGAGHDTVRDRLLPALTLPSLRQRGGLGPPEQIPGLHGPDDTGRRRSVLAGMPARECADLWRRFRVRGPP